MQSGVCDANNDSVQRVSFHHDVAIIDPLVATTASSRGALLCLLENERDTVTNTLPAVTFDLTSSVISIL